MQVCNRLNKTVTLSTKILRSDQKMEKKRRGKDMVGNRNIIPIEIISDILSRLPVKSLCRFRCVSKLWLSLITFDTHFIKTHLNRSKNNNTTKEQLILFSHDQHSFYAMESPPEGEGEGEGGGYMAVKLEFPNFENPNSSNINSNNRLPGICGSCDGLLLLSTDVGDHFLLNPSIRAYHKLPKSSFYIRKLPKINFTSGSLYGFGYDASTDDYKVVRIFYYGEFEQICKNIVSVYSLKTKSWKRVKSSGYDFSLSHRSDLTPLPGVFLNGCLHWLAVPPDEDFGSGVTIASFDLSNEIVNNVPMPSFLPFDFQYDLSWCELGVLKGCLCLFMNPFLEGLDIFMMKEYRKRESWVKFSLSMLDLDRHFLTPLRFSEEEDVFGIVQDQEKLLEYGLEEGAYTEVWIRDKPSTFEAVTYVESLISPGSDDEI